MTQVNYLKTVTSWNEYPYYIRTEIIKQLQSRQKGQLNKDDQDKENLPVILSRISYSGAHGYRLLKSLTS